MTLSKSSWYYKLHILLYGEHAKDPKNFCPYFWKTIILGLVLIVPMTIASLPFMIISRIISKDPIKPQDEGYFSEYLFLAIIIDIALFFGYCMVAVWFYLSVKHFTFPLAIFGYGLLILIIFVWIKNNVMEARRRKRHEMLVERHQQGLPEIEERPNVLVEGIKAWYKKNCPIINWK